MSEQNFETGGKGSAKPAAAGEMRAAASDPIALAGKLLARASLDACIKCTICESQCPVMRATPLFAGPKYVGPQAERFRADASVDRTLDYCSGCSICTTSCPHGVKIAEINAQARAVMKAQHGMPLRDRLIVQTELEGQLLTPFAPLANAALAAAPVRKMVEAVIGVHAKAPMPKAQAFSFPAWWRAHERQRKRLRQGWLPLTKPGMPVTQNVADAQSHSAAGTPSRGPIVFFHGCAGGYFEVSASIATVQVLEHLGYEVIVPKQGCCGLAAQSNGLFKQATAQVLKLCAQLQAVGRELTIVSSSGSCAGMLRHEAHEIMGVDEQILADVGARVVETSEFLAELMDRGEFPLAQLRLPGGGKLTIPYHQPCQVKSQGIGQPAVRMMEAIPGVTVIESGQPCCGIAGTYGLKREKYAVAQRVGQPLFEFVRATNHQLAACETETCRWQIRAATGAAVIHPVQLIHFALGLGGREFYLRDAGTPGGQ